MPIKNGASVRQVQPAPITGTVVERRFNDSEDKMEYGVQCSDDSLRYFLEGTIEETAPATPATPGEQA